MPEPGADLYALLGVEPTATAGELAAAYRRRVRTLHPDASGGDPAWLANVVAAYQLLRDPARRADYDQRRRRSQPHTTGVPIPVRVHRNTEQPHRRGPALRAGPVHQHRELDQ